MLSILFVFGWLIAHCASLVPPGSYQGASRREPETLSLKTGKAAIATTLVFLAATSTSISPVYAATDNVSRGRELFQSNCAGCHAGGQNFVSEKKTLQKEALEKFQSLEKEKLQKFVETGMPHKLLPLKFESSDYSNVVDYVLDQALNDKW